MGAGRRERVAGAHPHHRRQRAAGRGHRRPGQQRRHAQHLSEPDRRQHRDRDRRDRRRRRPLHRRADLLGRGHDPGLDDHRQQRPQRRRDRGEVQRRLAAGARGVTLARNTRPRRTATAPASAASTPTTRPHASRARSSPATPRRSTSAPARRPQEFNCSLSTAATDQGGNVEGKTRLRLHRLRASEHRPAAGRGAGRVAAARAGDPGEQPRGRHRARAGRGRSTSAGSRGRN